MTRNDIIKHVGELIDDNKCVTLRTPEIESQLGTLYLFSNDLCNAPTARNRRLGARTYTLKQAERRLRELTPKWPPKHFEDGAFVLAVMNP